MGIFFTAGERKVRPGVYQRYENAGGGAIAGAQNGVAAVAVRADWGPFGQVLEFNGFESAQAQLGSGGTVAVIARLFEGGATTVKAVRLGAGGQAATATIKDNSDLEAVTLTARYPGVRALRFQLREALGATDKRELLLLEGQLVREAIQFPASDGGEVDALIEAVNSKSAYLTAAKGDGYSGAGKLALATGDLNGGQNPEVTNESYSSAFALLEPHRWNAIAVDTDNTGVHALLAAFMNRVYAQGKMGFAVVGEPVSVPFETRMEHAAAFNDYNVIYVGGGWEDAGGGRHEGADAAGLIAGLVAACPSSQSLTHRSIDGAIRPLELLTNNQYEQAISHGMLTLSASSAGVVWVDDAITTLVNPTGEDDLGWSKIKRAKIRFEVMSRASDTVEPHIGNIPNDSDGRSSIMQLVQGVLNAMMAEGKLLPGATVTCDSYEGDSAWFSITADDIDSLEKMYFTFKFRYSAA